jgi:hypothetical protein
MTFDKEELIGAKQIPEGFDTKDLREAKALLKTLNH